MDENNNAIRMISLSTFQVTTVADSLSGTAGDADGTGTGGPMFNAPAAVTTDGVNLYVTENNNRRIRQIAIGTGVVTTLAGPPPGTVTSTFGYRNGTSDPSTNYPLFRDPVGITTDGTYLYVADVSNHVIRRISISGGVVTTLAGIAPNVVAPGEIDGMGTAARFNFPVGVTTDGIGLFISDRGSNVIRRIR